MQLCRIPCKVTICRYVCPILKKHTLRAPKLNDRLRRKENQASSNQPIIKRVEIHKGEWINHHHSGVHPRKVPRGETNQEE